MIKKNTILCYRNWVSLFLVLMIFRVAIYANNSGEQVASDTLPANPDENAVTQEALPSDSTGSSETASENEIATGEPASELKGSPLPDELTKSSLDSLLTGPYMPIDILVGEQYLITETDAFSFHGIIYVPLRSITNLVQGSVITWNQENLQADVTLPINGMLRNLSFYANSTMYTDNGVVTPLPSATLQKDGKMILPLSFITGLLGMEMNYDPVYHTVTLDPKAVSINPAALESRFYNPDELKYLSRLIYKEAGGTSYTAMHAVASVILNHVRHPRYANTLSGVIFAVAPSGAPHYTPAHKPGFSSVVPNYSSILAAKKVLRGENSIGQAIYFNTRPFKNKKILTKINGIYFCY